MSQVTPLTAHPDLHGCDFGKPIAAELPLPQDVAGTRAEGWYQDEPVFPQWRKHYQARRVRDAMVDWLGSVRTWEAFATWTWDGRWGATGPTPRSAASMIEAYLSECDLKAWWCLETGPRGGRVHAHGLIGTHKGLGLRPYRKELWKHWYKRFGRNRIEPVTDSLPVAYYVSKYSLKDFWSDGYTWGLVT